MTRRQRGRLVSFAAALTVVGVLVLSFWTPGQRPALASPAPTAARPLSPLESVESCRLSLGDEVKAIKAFGEMVPVFKHPRCINCHGALDLYSDKHPGASAIDEGLNLTLLTRKLRDVVSKEQCETCHDNIVRKDHLSGKGGWMIPNPPVFFVDKQGKPKTDEQLCLQMKWMEETPDSFTSHITKDHNTIQFIRSGYVGDRALGDSGLADAKPPKRDPPKGSQAQLGIQAKKWVKLLDGHWKEPPGKPSSPPSKCGCVMPGIKLQVEHRSAIDPTHATHRSGWVGFSGDAKFEVTLAKVHEAQGLIYYRGEKSLVRSLRTYFVDKRCKGTASQQEEWLWTAEVDTASEKMTLQWSSTRSEEKGEGECITGGYRSRVPLEPSLFGGQSLEPLVVSLDRDTVEVTGKEEDGSGREWLKIKVLAAPEE